MTRTPLHPWIAGRIGVTDLELTRQAIERVQLANLRETLSWAKERSTFYRAHLQGHEPRDLARLSDLASFPFTTSTDLRRQAYRFLCVSQSEVARVVTLRTSGTTGDPKRIFFDAHDQESTIDFFHHGMSTLVGPNDRILILMPGTTPGSVGDLLAKGLDRLGAIAIPHGLVLNIPQAHRVMESENVDCLVGLPTQVLWLARMARGGHAPRCVLLSADHVPAAIARELQRIWNCEVFAHYGMTEMGFGGGVECQARRGYHLREVDLYVEIVHPKTGSVVPDGQHGEVVFTTLRRRAMPLIRYRTGDISRFIPEVCPCGTVLRTLAPVAHRLDAYRALGNGTSISMADLDEAIFPLHGILDFSATLVCESSGDCLHLEVRSTGQNHSSLQGHIREALMRVSPIRSAVLAGALVIRTTGLPQGEAITRSSPKRTIADVRGVIPGNRD
ncbi:MAG: DVU_1553 family AMP-dependent CoA ligase [Syntrophobacteraceae bacterium]